MEAGLKGSGCLTSPKIYFSPGSGISYKKDMSLYLIAFCTLALLADSQDNPYCDPDREYCEENEDIWFGPGFYYGIWFDEEPDYWQWRHHHRHYPSNRNYYNRHHPIEYHHGGHGGEMHDRGDHGGRGGGHGGGRK